MINGQFAQQLVVDLPVFRGIRVSKFVAMDHFEVKGEIPRFLGNYSVAASAHCRYRRSNKLFVSRFWVSFVGSNVYTKVYKNIFVNFCEHKVKYLYHIHIHRDIILKVCSQFPNQLKKGDLYFFMLTSQYPTIFLQLQDMNSSQHALNYSIYDTHCKFCGDRTTTRHLSRFQRGQEGYKNTSYRGNVFFAFIHIVQSYNMIHSAKFYRRARIHI